MTLTRRMDRHGLITTEAYGDCSIADFLDGALELGELTAYSSELWEVVILNPELVIKRDHRLSLELVHAAKETLQFKARGAVAFYAPVPHIREWAEKVAVMLRGDRIPVVVFSDESDARKWLEIHRDTSRYSATTRIFRPHPDWTQAAH